MPKHFIELEVEEIDFIVSAVMVGIAPYLDNMEKMIQARVGFDVTMDHLTFERANQLCDKLIEAANQMRKRDG